MVDYDFLLTELKRTLKEKKLKFTPQREMVFKAIFENEGHFSPEELHQLIKEANPDARVGIATVYRTLSVLEEARLIDSISFGKEGKKYEIGFKKHHDHLICIECGKIIEFFDEIIEKRQEEVAKKFDFKMQDHSMKIVGICKECLEKKKENSN